MHHVIRSNDCRHRRRNPGRRGQHAPGSGPARLLSHQKKNPDGISATGVDGGPQAHAVGSWRAELDVTPAIGQRIAPENHRQCSRTALRVGAHPGVDNSSLAATPPKSPVLFFNRFRAVHTRVEHRFHIQVNILTIAFKCLTQHLAGTKIRPVCPNQGKPVTAAEPG